MNKVTKLKLITAAISNLGGNGALSAAQFEGMVNDYLDRGWDLMSVQHMKTSQSPEGGSEFLWTMATLVMREDVPVVSKASAK